MKFRKFAPLILVLMVLSCSCAKLILGEDEANTPENNFEVLWNELNEHYALFGPKNIDWDAVYDTYKPQISQNTTSAELWEITTSVLDILNDGHTTIYNPLFDSFFESGDSLNQLAEDEFDLEHLKSDYLDNYTVSAEPDISYGKIKEKDIGFIHIYELEGDNPDVIEDIVSELNQHQAIIIDIRNNGGGYDSYSRRLAGAFADGEHFIYTVQSKNGPGHSDFNRKKEWYTKPKGSEQFLKPVILLTDRYSASAAEIFALNMRAFNHVTLIGDSTAGDFSDLSGAKFLPNGWEYTYSPHLFLMPDGESLEGKGVPPEIYIKNTISSISDQTDLVIEKAIDYLFEEYGIE